MAIDRRRYPILVDTDALLAVSNTPLWETCIDHVGLTTTNVCEHELEHHHRETRATAPEGSREHRLHHGSKRVLDALDDDSVPLTRVVSVPRPHGADAGEESLRREVIQNPDAVDVVVLMDANGRRSIRRAVRERSLDVRVLAPPFLFFVLHDNELISRAEFCEACAELLLNEGWTGYQAVRSAWDGIPVDCSEHVSDDLLP